VTNVKLHRKATDKTRVYKCLKGCTVMRADAVDREVIMRITVAAAEHGVTILPGEQAPDTAPLRKREQEIVTDLDTYRAAMVKRELTAEFALPLVNSLERELAQVREDIGMAERTVTQGPEYVRAALARLESADLGEARAVLGRFYERITIHRRYEDQDDDEARIVSRFSGWVPADSDCIGDVTGVYFITNIKTGKMAVSGWRTVGPRPAVNLAERMAA
jgi:hypothetical protein